MQSPASLGRPRLALVRGSSLADADDTTLARAAADADPAAPGVVWDRYSALVRRVIQRILGPRGEVEDHVQETFLRYFKDPSVVRDAGALRPFLYGVAVRVGREALRRRRVRRWFLLTDSGALPEEAAPAIDETAREALARLYKVLDQQGDAERLAFVLRHVEGLELTDVAASLEVSLATVKRLLGKVDARVEAAAARDPLLAPYLGADRAGSEEES